MLRSCEGDLRSEIANCELDLDLKEQVADCQDPLEWEHGRASDDNFILIVWMECRSACIWKGISHHSIS